LRSRFANICAPGRLDQSARTVSAARCSLASSRSKRSRRHSMVPLNTRWRALGIDPEIARQRRIAGQNRRLPALESLAQ
jgi:hypothetical protein